MTLLAVFALPPVPLKQALKVRKVSNRDRGMTVVFRYCILQHFDGNLIFNLVFMV